MTVTSTDVDIGDAECREDFLMIPGGWGGTDPNNAMFTRDRYCGQAFGYCTKLDCTTREIGTVRSYQTPFTLGVVTDNDEGRGVTLMTGSLKSTMFAILGYVCDGGGGDGFMDWTIFTGLG